MFNYESGKKIMVLGFGANLLVNLGYLIYELLRWLMGFHFGLLSRILDLGTVLSFGVVAIGFLILWLSKKDMIDLISCGATGIYAGYFLAREFTGISWTIGTIAVLLFYAVMTLRAQRINNMLCFAMLCALGYETLVSLPFFLNFIFRFFITIGLSEIFFFLVWYVGYVICAGICLFEAINEYNKKEN